MNTFASGGCLPLHQQREEESLPLLDWREHAAPLRRSTTSYRGYTPTTQCHAQEISHSSSYSSLCNPKLPSLNEEEKHHWIEWWLAHGVEKYNLNTLILYCLKHEGISIITLTHYFQLAKVRFFCSWKVSLDSLSNFCYAQTSVAAVHKIKKKCRISFSVLLSC